MADKDTPEKQVAHWWEGKSCWEVLDFQLFSDELCMPEDLYIKALNSALLREVSQKSLKEQVEWLKAEYQEKRPIDVTESIQMMPFDINVMLNKVLIEADVEDCCIWIDTWESSLPDSDNSKYSSVLNKGGKLIFNKGQSDECYLSKEGLTAGLRIALPEIEGAIYRGFIQGGALSTEQLEHIMQYSVFGKIKYEG